MDSSTVKGQVTWDQLYGAPAGVLRSWEPSYGVEKLRSNPPLLIGGSVKGCQSLVGVGVDFLTASVDETCADFLRSKTEVIGLGRGISGFARSEERDCFGIRCWRRWEPTGPRTDWGMAYESWEWDIGHGARHAGDLLRGWNPAPSRVDICFDFNCDRELTADDVVAVFSPVAKRKGFKIGISGDDGLNTRYVGSRKTGLRVIRIYRKDLQMGDGLWVSDTPIMRIELVLRKKQARAWWNVWEVGHGEGYQAAARIIYEMTGIGIVEQLGELPELEDDADRGPEETLWSAIDQYAVTFSEFRKGGMDWDEFGRLVDSRAAQASRPARERGKRLGRRIRVKSAGRIMEALTRRVRARGGAS